MSSSRCALSGPCMTYFMSLKAKHKQTKLCAPAPRHYDACRSGSNASHLKRLMSAACFDFAGSHVRKYRRKWGHLCMWHNSCLISAFDGTIVTSSVSSFPPPLTYTHRPSLTFLLRQHYILCHTCLVFSSL
jgi:hypothetical protein